MKGNKMSRKAILPPDEFRAIGERVLSAIENGATLYVTVPHTSRSNMAYTVRARLIGGNNNSDIWLNYWLASGMGATLNDSDDIRQNGCGTDRAFLVACDIADILKQLGLVANRFEYEIKRAWF